MFLYNRADDYAEKNLLVADIMGIESSSEFYYKRNFVNSYLIMCVTKGLLHAGTPDCLHELCPGRGILMDLRKPHLYFFENGVESEIHWFHFHGFTADCLLNDKMPLLFDTGDILSDIGALFSLSGRYGPEKIFRTSHTVYGILLKVLEQQFPCPADFSDFRGMAEDYISRHMAEEINLEAFARALHVSKSYFCRRFHKEFGTTASAYIQKEKVALAKKLLIHTNKKLADISASLGFYDQSHFSRTFSGITGTTPGMFRKRSE